MILVYARLFPLYDSVSMDRPLLQHVFTAPACFHEGAKAPASTGGESNATGEHPRTAQMPPAERYPLLHHPKFCYTKGDFHVCRCAVCPDAPRR
jgi:hypothetical protein